jgi:hypothetical protein
MPGSNPRSGRAAGGDQPQLTGGGCVSGGESTNPRIAAGRVNVKTLRGVIVDRGTVTITTFTARALNQLAGKHAFAAGNVLGTATASPTLVH